MAVLQQIVVPLLSVNDTELTVVSTPFKSGQAVRKGDIILVFETSKTTYDVISEADGFIDYRCDEGADYAVNAIVALIHERSGDVHVDIKGDVGSPQLKNNSNADSVSKDWNGAPLISRKAAKLMLERQVGAEKFAGMDFVSIEDVESLLGIRKQPINKTAKQDKPADKTLLPEHENYQLIPLSKNKKREIAYLSEVQSAGLISTIHHTIELDGVFQGINPSLKYFRNSLLPVVMFESARLLKKFPLLNAYFGGDSIVQYDEPLIGFAVDIDKGLKVIAVPVANAGTLREVEESIYRLSLRYTEDKLELADLSNITFTITDLSAEGVQSFIPLVNRMNGAILGISAIDQSLQRSTLSLTFDHRITEGRTAAVFLKELDDRIRTYAVKDQAWKLEKIRCHKCRKSVVDDLSETGFVRVITPAGEEGYICSNCLNGF